MIASEPAAVHMDSPQTIGWGELAKAGAGDWHCSEQRD